MDKVVHFEIPYDNVEEAKSFYEKVFGWKIQSIPEMNYNIVHTVNVDEQQMPTENRSYQWRNVQMRQQLL
ncbi:hypothetical protein J4221_05360 [Candidatus Pacearchaeota archaeon]|nr:hypothetical protein [Candidatus Pacearchaeota archaeon]